MKEITLTIAQLEHLLDEQKDLVATKLLNQTGSYNKESTDGNYKTLPIDEHKFKRLAMNTDYPTDVQVMKKYIK